MLATLVILIVVLMAFGGFIWFFARIERNPIYRTSRESMLELLERVERGEANDIEWRTFLSVPIRHDDYLDELRLRCEYLDDRYSRQIRGQLLSRQGREELAKVIEQLKQYDHKEF
ncbi:MAG: hypothetical protein LAT62_00895 [Natronospirillum sp.]|uniref:hypothetical protein n=1 Tax=Natronospirillum sp. TaxID=2812955 RepID=UPI0025EE9857|nr:hypothetical protein [Natronospirillum sp.]MCH8550460.1 hypothetical protein [Natronospirillum sp.]